MRRLTDGEWDFIKHAACRAPWGHTVCVPDQYADDEWEVEYKGSRATFHHPALGTSEFEIIPHALGLS